MYTVLLTDDEKSVTESLKNDIPWANLGVESILTACDGMQALELSLIHIYKSVPSCCLFLFSSFINVSI